MSKLLVAHNYHLALDPPEAALGRPFPPLGTLVTVAEARARGLDVAFYDATFAPRPDAFADALAGHRPERVAIVPDPHAVPQKMCTTAQRDAAREMIRLAHAHGAQVCIGGPDATDHPEAYAEADLVIPGEHDRAVLAFLAGDPTRGVLPHQPARDDVDTLPFPAWEDADLARYRDRWRASTGRWELNVSTTRGCPYRCNWCAKPTWGRTARIRPAAAVAAEVLALHAAWAPDRIAFTDDIFALKRGWLDAYRAAVGPRAVPFRCLSRADLLVEPGYVDALRAAGCVEVWMGAESGSQPILDAMDKDQTVEEIRDAAARLHAAGIRVGLFLQLGYPGERYADVLATVAMVRAVAPADIGVSLTYPLPGTPLYERVRDRMTDTRWTHSMENRPLYATPYAPAFYDAARALLRAEHALRTFRPTPDRRGLRRAAGAAFHAARWPLARAELAARARFGERPA